MEKAVSSLEALEAAAREFLASLPKASESATLVALSGELGAGKTAFTKAVAEALGVTDVVTSPTFVLEKIYRLPEGAPFSRLVHIDAYRLHSGAELQPLGFDALMRDPANLILLEWPEKVADGLPEPAVRIAFMPLPSGGRVLSYG